MINPHPPTDESSKKARLTSLKHRNNHISRISRRGFRGRFPESTIQMRLPHSFLLQKKDFMIGLRWKTETQPENLLRKETKRSQPMQFPLNLPDDMFA